MDIERYHREVLHHDDRTLSPSARKIKVYRGSDTCESYCAERAAGADAVFIGRTCRCESHKNELRDAGSDREAVNRRQETISTPSPFLGFTGPNTPARTTVSAVTEPTDTNGALESAQTVWETESATISATLDNESSVTMFLGSTGSSSVDWMTTSMTASTSDSSYSDDAAEPSETVASIGASDSGGLSAGGKIGLGVGLGVGIALLLAAVAFFCLAQRRRRKSIQMGAKYTPHAQSDLSMIEQSQPVQMKAEQAHDTQLAERQPLQGDYNGQSDASHSQVYYEPLPPIVNIYHPPATDSPVTPIDVAARSDDLPGAPLILAIPDEGRKSGVSRDPSPVRSHSPVSPVSPLSALSPANSRPPSPKAK